MSKIIYLVNAERRSLNRAEGDVRFVKGDKFVDSVEIWFPEDFDEMDLDTSLIRIMYKAPGESEVKRSALTSYRITDEGFIVYTWSLATLTDVSGDVAFSVCLLDLEDDGQTIEYEWHTTPAAFSIVNTIHGETDAIVPEAIEVAIETQIQALRAEVSALIFKINNVNGGLPVPVSLASGMVDEYMLYLYTGNEEGYQHGYWYYYDGTAWVSGGVYNAVAVETDDTLTQQGEAADAKAVGDALTQVSNAISQKQDAPSTAGTAGQVLGLDSNLDPVWVNQSGGGDVSNCAPIIINTASGDIASFADGADNRQICKIVGTIETEEGGSGWTGCVIGNSVPAPTDKAFSFLPRQSGSGDPSPTNVRPFLPYTLTLDDDSQVTILGGDVKFNGDGSADVTETWAKCTIAEIRSQAIGPSAYATGMFSTILYYQTYKIEPSGVTNVMSDSYKQTDVAMGSMADDTIRNFNGTIYLRDTRYSNGTELVAGMGNAVIAYEIKKTQERPVYHLSNSAQLLPILAENGYALQTLPINWQTVAGTISNGTVTLNEDGSVDLINSDSGTNYHLTGIGSLMTYFGQNNVWIDTGAITECDYPADTKLYIDGLTAPDEDMIADGLIASGKYFTVNNQLYLSTAQIAAGAQIIPGSNCTATSITEALNALNA